VTADIPESQDWNKLARTPVRDHVETLNQWARGGDVHVVTFALIAVGVELFGLACGLALARAAATDR
jgi:hypothetical protein